MTATSMRPTGNISGRPRTVVLWQDGQRIEHKDVPPEKFGPERAAEIKASLGCFGDSLTRHMTPEEIAYVQNVWEAIPSGSSTFTTAFNAIIRGDT